MFIKNLKIKTSTVLFIHRDNVRNILKKANVDIFKISNIFV